MVVLPRRSLGTALRITIAVACCFGIWDSWELARADYLFRRDTEPSVRSAIHLVPDGWEYYMRLAQFDRVHVSDLLTTSLNLNRYDAEADIELGLQYESEGDFGRAETKLLDAFQVDHTYLPRWSLANFYFRRDNVPEFWLWARKAAEMPSANIGPLFELCWHVTHDPEQISGAILNQNPEVARQYLQFLLAKNQMSAVPSVAQRLVHTGEPETDRPLMLAVMNRLVAESNGAAANALWQSLIKQRWLVGDSAVPNNPGFVRTPLPVSFDWNLPEYPGLHSWPGPSGLEAEFSGTEPESCTLAEQALPLSPGNYKLAYAYHSSDIPPDTGISWEILDGKLKTTLASSADLSSDTPNHSELKFSVPPDISLVWLRLTYRRALGTPRISGTLVVESTQIQRLPSS
jgi:hypothetical protein